MGFIPRAITFIIIFCLAFTPFGGDFQSSAQTLELAEPNTITLNFNEADILDVLRLLSYKSGINIVAGADVAGLVTIHLKDVTWQEALDIITQSNGYAYTRSGNIVIVGTFESLRKIKEEERFLNEMDSLVSKVFVLKYLDANDVKPVIEPQLSSRGKVTILRKTAEAGWTFDASSDEGASNVGARSEQPSSLRSNKLVVSDIPSYMKRVERIITDIDRRPKQILIKSRIMEVRKDALKDLGVDIGTGIGGAQSAAIQTTNTQHNRYGGQALENRVAPALFNPLTTALGGAFPFNAGITLLYQQLTGQQFEIILHALEEDANTNILSAPSILALDGHAAVILIGSKYPILSAETVGTDTTTVSTSLDYYQEIGIQLKVVPKVTANNEIDMIIHPSVSDISGTVSANSPSGVQLASYPILQTREAETNVSMRSGDTIIMGGLLKDGYDKDEIGIPILGDIPYLGELFKRHTTDKEKIDLLITITAYIIEDDITLVDGTDKEKEYVMEEIIKAKKAEQERKRLERKRIKEEKIREKKEAWRKKKEEREAKNRQKELERRNRLKKKRFQEQLEEAGLTLENINNTGEDQ